VMGGNHRTGGANVTFAADAGYSPQYAA